MMGDVPEITWTSEDLRVLDAPDGGDGTDRLRLEVTRAAGAPRGEVRVLVNGTRLTGRDGLTGIDPLELFVPANRLEAAAEPRTVTVAGCACGSPRCRGVEVTVARDGDTVTWTPVDADAPGRPLRFDAADYAAEVRRAAADRTWESPALTTARTVLERADHALLAEHGLRLEWLDVHPRTPTRFTVCLVLDDRHQVFVEHPWDAARPAAVADEVGRTLAEHPTTWTASWVPLATWTGAPGAAVAGPGWSRWRLTPPGRAQEDA